MSVSEREAFLKAIAAVPDDDTARLAFADWLDEHGDPDRAEFVRLQIRRARFGGEPCPRETELFGANRDAWLGPLAQLGDCEFEFERGFVESAAVRGSDIATHAGALREHCPALTKLDLIGVRGFGKQIADALPESVRVLQLEDWPHPDDARALAQSPRLARLETLSLWVGLESDAAVLRTLAESRAMPALNWVQLVQLYGGLQAGERAGELNVSAATRAIEFNAARGSVIAHVYRPFDGPFPLNENVGYDLYAGTVSGGEDVLVRCGQVCEVLSFNRSARLQSGALIDLTGELSAAPDFAFEKYNRAEVLARLHQRIGFVPGRIVVREFAGRSVLPSSFVEVYKFGTFVDFQNGFLDEPNAEARESSIEHIRYYLRSSNFCVGYGNECIADDSGQIHTT